MTVEAHAKVNFTLEVFGTRPDGYHALRSLVVPVSLSDTLTVEKAETASSDSPYGEKDLAVRAARALGVGARLSAVKRIPVGGGLGGGSADAAAALRALNALYGLGRSPAELAAVGATVGSDVPALVFGGPVLMEGRGECVTPVAPLPSLDLVLANPGVPVSTPDVFAAFDRRGAASEKKNGPLSPTGRMLAALAAGDRARIAAALQNDLEDVTVALCPAIADVLAALRASGALGARMSGSGATCFGLCDSPAAAQAAAERLAAHGFRAWAVRTL